MCMVASLNSSFVSSSSTPIQLSLAEKLKKARDTASLSQAELAERFEVSQRTLQNWEAGVRPRPKHRRAVLAFIADQEEVAA